MIHSIYISMWFLSCFYVCVCVCSGSCFLEWFTSYVHNVVTGEYPIIRDQIFR